jgi:hypothetical protein
MLDDHHCDITGLNRSYLVACGACQARFLEARDRRAPDPCARAT